jgi:ferrous iron transport protein B
MRALLEQATRDTTKQLHAAQNPLVLAIAGNPNAGKTSLFNALTGLRQKVANYPGVTVERKEGLWSLGPGLPAARVIDLPGLYSLEATSVDEEIARDVLLGQNPNTPLPDVVIVAIDATNLVRNLYLLTELMETGCRLVVALTMFDLANRGKFKIDVATLSDALDVPVIPVVARQHDGIDRLGQAVLKVAAENSRGEFVGADAVQLDNKRHRDLACTPRVVSLDSVVKGTESWQTNLIERYRWIENVVNASVQLAPNNKQCSTTERIDALITHKIAGPAILVLIMLFVFQTIFSWANLPMNLIDRFFVFLAEAVRGHLLQGMLTDLISAGIIPGVGGVLMFLPQIVLLFLFITILEDSGYMARAAFLMDRVMRVAGLHGKAFVPLLSSFACAVPGIMATRTIENPKDRFTTIMIAPFMSCSARLPVYTLMIAAFFSGQKVMGFISLGTLIILLMYMLGVVIAVLVGWILKHTFFKGPSTPFVMELPPYRVPQLGNVVHSLFSRVGIFLQRAGTVILVISILLWGLVAFPRLGGPATVQQRASQVENSYAGRLGRVIEPVIQPLGFDWKIGIGLISSFAARETVISTLSIVYNVGENTDEGPNSLIDGIRHAKRADGSPVWTPLVALSLMVFFVLACQCMSTVAVVRRETNSLRWPLFMICYMLILAYVSSLATFQVGRFLGFS